jgi:glycerol-3-phosphate dehydrogenase (NAD(P)+)
LGFSGPVRDEGGAVPAYNADHASVRIGARREAARGQIMSGIRIAVLGAGGWGTALALVAAQQPARRVALWAARAEQAKDLLARRENVRFLPGVPIPENVQLTTDIAEAVAGVDLIVEAIPTIYLRPTFGRIASALPAGVPLVSGTKGIEIETLRRPTEILASLTGPRRLAVLSGPSHAEEVARQLPTTVVAASSDPALAQLVQQSFNTERFRVYTNLDVIGVELAGALKNVIGIAAGICDGLGYGDNAMAALMTRGLAEMSRFGVALGAEPQTFVGLAGMGDLITTCMSRHGRNRAVGLRLAKGERPADILAGMSMVAEGVYTARSVHDKASRMDLPMPITAEVYRVLYEGKDPRQAVQDLMVRALKSE